LKEPGDAARRRAAGGPDYTKRRRCHFTAHVAARTRRFLARDRTPRYTPPDTVRNGRLDRGIYRTWTRRRTSLPPRCPGARAPLLGATILLAACILPACGGNDRNENRIKPVEASLTIVPFPGTPDPAVFLEEASPPTGDLVVLNVKLHNATGTPINFDAFTLEFTYDFRLIQAGTVFDINPALMGDCNAGTLCDPLCSTNAASANDGLTVDSSGNVYVIDTLRYRIEKYGID